MPSYNVQLTFLSLESESGDEEYIFPLVQTISDPAEGSKGIVHEGTRANGSIWIPAGKKSQKIKVTGILWADGYEALTEAINALKTAVTNDPATLTLKHDAESGYENDWQYTVVRLGEIEINDKNEMRTDTVEYTINFLVLSYN